MAKPKLRKSRSQASFVQAGSFNCFYILLFLSGPGFAFFFDFEISLHFVLAFSFLQASQNSNNHNIEHDMLLLSMGAGLAGLPVGPALQLLFEPGGALQHLPAPSLAGAHFVYGF